MQKTSLTKLNLILEAMKIAGYLIIVLVFIGCTNQDNNKRMVDMSETVIVASKMENNHDLSLSFYSFMQANDSGLFVTPTGPIDDTVLFKYALGKNGACCSELEGVIRRGRGPKELQNVHLSTRTVNGDSLLFYSFSDSQYLIFDNTGKPIGHFNASANLINTGSSFAYSNGYLLVPSLSKMLARDFLLTLMNLNDGHQIDFFEPRVPVGYEPSIRNTVFPMSALPDGFAFSFLGDRRVYVTGFDGEVKRELVFGKSDPIPRPYMATNPLEAPASRPYVTKIEFHRGHLFVLVERIIWVLDYPALEVKHKIKAIRNIEEESAPVVDFSITDRYLFLRFGLDGIYYIPSRNDWFNDMGL